MTKSRASLKGRGGDILLGGSAGPGPSIVRPAPAAEPGPSAELVPAAAAAPNPFAEPEAVAAAALGPFAEPGPAVAAAPNPFAEPEPVAAAAPGPFAEPLPIAAAAPNPFAEPVPAPAELEPVAEPAIDEASFQNELAGGQPSAPVSTTLPPEETAWLADEPLPIPEAPAFDTAASGGPVSVPLSTDPTLFKTPKIGGLFMEMPSIPQPESFQPSTGLTQTELTAVGVSRTEQTVAEEEVLRRIGPERIQALSRRIDDLYAQVAAGTIAESKKAGEALLYLRQARDKELEDQRQYDEAEYLVNVAQYLVTRGDNVRRWGYSYGVMILIYALFWLVVYVVSLFLGAAGLLRTWTATFIGDPNLATLVSAFFSTMMSGGLGAVLGMLYSLFKHISERQDFDRQYVMWYMVQPFLGLLTGFIIHLFFVAGLFQIIDAESPSIQAIGWLLAFAAAFRQHYVYAWLESLLKAFQPGGRQLAKSAAEAPMVSSAAVPPAPAPSQPEPSAPSEPAGVG